MPIFPLDFAQQLLYDNITERTNDTPKGTTAMIIDIPATVTSKRTIKLCRENADGTLTIIGSAKVTVITDFANDLETCTYQQEAYTVKGTIHMSYIVIA
jgi:hypothetical protein